MVAVGENLTIAEFQSRYGKGDRAFEFWYGRAIPKCTPTWFHGVLQYIVMRLLDEAGYVPGSEIELRIDPGARPSPDVIAAKRITQASYPTKAVEVIVEILSPECRSASLRNRVRMRPDSSVDPQSRSLTRWAGELLEETSHLTTIPASAIWQRLDQFLEPKES